MSKQTVRFLPPNPDSSYTIDTDNYSPKVRTARDHQPTLPGPEIPIASATDPIGYLEQIVGTHCRWPKGTVIQLVEYNFALFSHGPTVQLAQSRAQLELYSTPTTSADVAVFAKPKFYYEGIGFCSLSEAAFGVLMERFIPSFSLVTGSTFQVPLGGGRSADFRLGNVLIEYHHLRFKPQRRRFGDFESEAQYKEYTRGLRRFRHQQHRRNEHIRQMKDRLTKHYFEKRRKIIDMHPVLRKAELIVATSLEEFYAKVICRFGGRRVPSLQAFSNLFHEQVRIISKESRYKAA